MAAYAALVSLMTTLNNIQTHPRVSTFFHHKHIQSLHQIINFLLDFIESGNSHGGSREVEALESRIASTAHAAEDVIESHVVDQILAGATNLLDLVTQIEDMNSVKETVKEFRGTMKFKDEQSSHSMTNASYKPTTAKNFMVGFEEKVIQIMDRLTRQEPGLQIVPIVGMGGIGKTTLAKSVFDNLLIVRSFDIRAWVTISQECSVKNVLFELLSCIKDPKINENIGAFDCGTNLDTEDHQLGLKLYQTLWGRRYLIVLDDMWSVEAWDRIKFFFPNNDDRSRVVITTRISSVATPLSSSLYEMTFLDEDQSWKLFCENVFLGKGCPPDLEEIGKKIVRLCKGLPLSIVVIGGVLRNSRSTREYYENFARDLNSILMSENDEHCFIILSLSYNHLPAHLKPCFLYMGVFQEDDEICVSKLINLFVAEGFLKLKEGQTLEEVAEDYINDLVDRNLILVDSWKRNGRIKYCKMHDLVREVCLKISENEKIFHRMKMLDIPAGIHRQRRIVFDGIIPIKKNWTKAFDVRPSASLARTFISNGGLLPFKFQLLRVLTRVEIESLEDISQHVNLRLLDMVAHSTRLLDFKLPSSISLLWNVHTLIFIGYYEIVDAPSEIWYMRQLRHLQFYRILLPDPPSSEKVEQEDDVLLPNLHTLSEVVNLSFTEEVCKRIPNIKKLGIMYIDKFGEQGQKKCCYHLGHLHKLQSLYCSFDAPKRGDLLQSLVFPRSMKKLTLDKCHLYWEDLNTFGLSLPNLEVLKLYEDAFVGPEWDCVEGAFPRLKYLLIGRGDLVKWTAENSEFFPVLEQLHLGYLSRLEKVPSGIREIQTLVCVHVEWCSLSAAISSLEILEEQLNLGNEDLQLVLHLKDNEEISLIKKQVEMKSFFTCKNLEIDIDSDKWIILR